MKSVLSISVCSIILLLSTTGLAQTGSIDTKTECTTKSTNASGKRHSCKTQPSCVTAPAGFFVDENKVSLRKIKSNGSEHDCWVKYAGEVNILQYIQGNTTVVNKPNQVCVQGDARSPKGHSSGRGWVGCHLTGAFDAIPNYPR